MQPAVCVAMVDSLSAQQTYACCHGTAVALQQNLGTVQALEYWSISKAYSSKTSFYQSVDRWRLTSHKAAIIEGSWVAQQESIRPNAKRSKVQDAEDATDIHGWESRQQDWSGSMCGENGISLSFVSHRDTELANCWIVRV